MKINYFTWYGNRELEFLPAHFVRGNTLLDDEKKMWVYEKLNGRFFISESVFAFLIDGERTIYFEDPQEAMFYDLTWS